MGGKTVSEYNAAGWLLNIKDPVGNKTSYFRNKLGLVWIETDALGGTKVYTYTSAGQLDIVTDELGREMDHAYYPSGLLQKIDYRNFLGGPVVNTKSFTYNENQQLETAADNNGTYTFLYDELGRLDLQIDVHALTLNYNYDPATGLLDTVTDTFGGTRDYGWDDAGRLDSIKFTDATAAANINFDYTDRNELWEIRRYSDANGTVLASKSTFAHDDAGRVMSILHTNSVGATVDSFAYQYDNANRLIQETTLLDGTKSLTYDRTDQLLTYGSETFGWDKNGNPTGGGFGVGPGNRVTTDGTWTFTWNAVGNLVSKVKIATTETWLFTYNGDNQLTKAEHKATSAGPVDLRVEQKYDVFGNRIEKSVDADGDGGGAAVVTKFAYEGGNAWADLTSAGSLITRRLYGFGLDTLLARIGSSGNEDWYLLDKLGSVRNIVNSAGAVIDHLAYSAFGEILTETQPANGDRYKFTAQEWDSDFALYLFGFRYLDPKLRRFTSEDPLGFGAGDANLYRYVGNGPTNGTDPTGLQAEPSFWDELRMGFRIGIRLFANNRIDRPVPYVEPIVVGSVSFAEQGLNPLNSMNPTS